MDSELTGLEHLALTPVAPEQARRAALYTASAATNAADCAALLDALGLLPRPKPHPRHKRTAVPTTTVSDCPINTRAKGDQ